MVTEPKRKRKKRRRMKNLKRKVTMGKVS